MFSVQNSLRQPREKDFKNSDKQEVQLEIKTEKCPKESDSLEIY